MDEQGVNYLEVALNLGIPLVILVVAYVIGTIIEKNHYKSIREREERLAYLPAVPSCAIDRTLPTESAVCVYGSVVVSIDYFKRVLAALRNIVGGRVRSYESVVDRGRREAILRMKEAAPDADIIVNLRLETSTISRTNSNGKKSVGCVEVIAYGTAVKYAKVGA